MRRKHKMKFEIDQDFVSDIKCFVTETLPLSRLTDDELEEKVEEIVGQRMAGQYCPIEKRLAIVQQIFSSIRGFGLLDSIISDDTITEVMINGPDNIFVEKFGRLTRLPE